MADPRFDNDWTRRQFLIRTGTVAAAGAAGPLMKVADGTSTTHTYGWFSDRYHHPTADTMESVMKLTKRGDILSYVLHTLFDMKENAVGISNTDNPKPSPDDYITLTAARKALTKWCRRCPLRVRHRSDARRVSQES